MKDDPDFNIHFVAAIEAKSCVYDHTNVNYTNRNVQDRAWEQISKEVNEPVPECKERWKNIRGSYTRYLKYKYTPQRKKKKPYYLANYLKFLRPYTKSRPSNYSTGAVSVPSNDFDDEDSESENDQENEVAATVHPKIEVSSLEYSALSPVHNHKLSSNVDYSSSDSRQSSPAVPEKASRHCSKQKNGRDDFGKSTFEYLKSAALRNEKRLQDPDVSFLMSVLPDMKRMNDSQRRRFKISILESAINILDDVSNPLNIDPIEG